MRQSQERSIVTRNEDRTRQAQSLCSSPEPPDSALGKGQQAAIENRGVLSFEQTDIRDSMRDCYETAGQLFADDPFDLFLLFCLEIDRREDTTDDDRMYVLTIQCPLQLALCSPLLECARTQRRSPLRRPASQLTSLLNPYLADFAPIDLQSPLHHERRAFEDCSKLEGKPGERRRSSCIWPAQAYDRDASKEILATTDQCIDEMSCADADCLNVLRSNVASQFEHFRNRFLDSVSHGRRRGRFGRCEDDLSGVRRHIQDDGVGVGSAAIDTDAQTG